MAKAKAKSGMKRAPAKRRPRKAKPGTRGLTPAECRVDTLPGAAQEVSRGVDQVGGHLLGCYNDPLGLKTLASQVA
jgi:ParB family chromosome partitioning protein